MFKITLNKPARNDFFDDETVGMRVRLNDGQIAFQKSDVLDDDVIPLTVRGKGGLVAEVRGSRETELYNALRNPYSPFFTLKNAGGEWFTVEPYQGSGPPLQYHPHLRIWTGDEYEIPLAEVPISTDAIQKAHEIIRNYELTKRAGRPPKEVTEARRYLQQAVPNKAETGLTTLVKRQPIEAPSVADTSLLFQTLPNADEFAEKLAAVKSELKAHPELASVVAQTVAMNINMMEMLLSASTSAAEVAPLKPANDQNNSKASGEGEGAGEQPWIEDFDQRDYDDPSEVDQETIERAAAKLRMLGSVNPEAKKSAGTKYRPFKTQTRTVEVSVLPRRRKPSEIVAR